MRTLIIAHGHPDFNPGGGEMAAYQQFQEMRRRGMDAIFLAAHREAQLVHGGTPMAMLRPNEVLIRANMTNVFMLRAADLRALTHEFRTFLETQKPDVIHFHHVLHIGVYALRAAEMYRRSAGKPVKIVFTLHEYMFICGNSGQMITRKQNNLCREASPPRCAVCLDRTPEEVFLRETVFRSCLGLVDQFISPSQFLKDRFVDWGLAAPIAVIENGQAGVDRLPPRTLAGDERRTRFTYLGQINKFKGLDLLLEALDLLPEELYDEVVINVHGSGLEYQTEEFRKRIEELVEKHDNVILHGRYTGEELPGILQNSDTVIMPSIWWENSPLVIQEALKYGRPMIVSNIGGMAEKIRDGLDGLHFTRGSAMDLAVKMGRMIDPEFWQACHDRLAVPPTLEQTVDEILALYGSAQGTQQSGVAAVS